MKKVRLQAHRGVSSEYPENTLAAFRASVEEGYDIIELDLKFTKDEACVVLHDRTCNRTGRYPDGSPLQADTAIRDVTLETVRSWDFGVWKDEKFKGEQIPTLGEVLEFAASNPIPLKVDNVWETFSSEEQELLLHAVEEADLGNKIGFTCRKMETFRCVAERFPDAELHWDGDSDTETLEEVKRIAGRHRLTVWLCFDGDGNSRWYKGRRANPALCDEVRKYGEVGIWILQKPEELDSAIRDLHADAIETTGHLKPSQLLKYR